MTGQEAAITERLSGDPCYPRQFLAAFPEDKGEISSYTVTKALAAFERTLVSFDAPYDRYRLGSGELSPQARRGEALFMAGCATCHAGPAFTDAAGAKDVEASFHRIAASGGADPGLAAITEEPADAGRFRTPSLRNVALTGPYLHDGSAPTLAAAIRAHDDARTMADGEVAEIAAFLGALTDQGFVTDPRFSLPKPCR